MNIIGPDTVVFAVAGRVEAERYLLDYGLTPSAGQPGRFEALDGTGILLVAEDDPAFPDTLGTGNRLRKVIYGVADRAALEAIATEMADRVVTRNADGSLSLCDDFGFAIDFAVTARRQFDALGEAANAPGAPHQRPLNAVGFDPQQTPQPRTLSHFALFVPEVEGPEAFYRRLGFRVTDRLGGGPFMRPTGTTEHHTLFLIKTPPHMKGIEHLAFHVGGPGEVMRAGSRFAALGHQSSWGPGRHVMGSNWFWYFNSPLGCAVEYDADLDQVDDSWTPRELPFHPDNAQGFLFEERERFVPGAPPARAGAH